MVKKPTRYYFLCLEEKTKTKLQSICNAPIHSTFTSRYTHNYSLPERFPTAAAAAGKISESAYMHPRHTIWFFRVCSFQSMMIHGDTKNYPNPLFGRAQDQQSWCKALKTRSGFRLAAFSISTSSVWPLHSRNRFFSRRKPALEGVLQLTHDQVASFAQHYQWIDVHETIGWSICPRQSIDLHKASIFYKLLLLGSGLILDVGSVSLGSGRSPLLHQSGEVFPRQLRGDGVVA